MSPRLWEKDANLERGHASLHELRRHAGIRREVRTSIDLPLRLLFVRILVHQMNSAF
jgi:hypothetical protein